MKELIQRCRICGYFRIIIILLMFPAVLSIHLELGLFSSLLLVGYIERHYMLKLFAAYSEREYKTLSEKDVKLFRKLYK